MTIDDSTNTSIGQIIGETTLFGFNILLNQSIPRNSFLSVIHENSEYILSVQRLWKDKKGSFVSVRVVGDVPDTPFDMNCTMKIASPEQIRVALGMNCDPNLQMILGKILNSDFEAIFNIEKLGRVFITGKSGSGKSYTVGVLLEELMKKEIPIIVIDRHGEYSSLKILKEDQIPPSEIIFTEDAFKEGFARRIIEFGDSKLNPGVDLELEYLIASPPVALVNKGQCTILNLRGMDIPLQEQLVNELLQKLYKSSTLKEIPPFFLFIDEAHLFAGKKLTPIVETVRLFAQEGRKFGANLVVITQKPQALDTTIRAQAGTWIIHKLTDVNDIKITLGSAEGLSADSDEEIQMLNPGEAIITGDIAVKAPLRVKIRPRYTVHGGAGYNIMEYIQKGVVIPKSDLIELIKKKIPTDSLTEAQKALGTTKIANKKGSENQSSSINSADGEEQQNNQQSNNELQEQYEKLKIENEELVAQVQTLQLEISGLQVETNTWKEKYEAEKKNADKSIKLAEAAIERYKKEKSGKR